VSPPAPKGDGLDRVTINLVPRSSRALARAMELTGDSKTDCINRALPVYAYLEEILANGGSLLVQDGPDGELIKVVIL
jgi:hypothetical protein